MGNNKVAARREWLLRALWFNCDEVRAAQMPRITTRRGHCSHSHSCMLTPHTSRRRRAY